MENILVKRLNFYLHKKTANVDGKEILECILKTAFVMIQKLSYKSEVDSYMKASIIN